MGLPFPPAGKNWRSDSVYCSNTPSAISNKEEDRTRPDARLKTSLDERAESVAIHIGSNQEKGNGDRRRFPPGSSFAATRAGSARKSQGGQASDPNEATTSAGRRFFAPSRRRRLRQRRREGAEPPSGGRVDPVATRLSRRAWPRPARVERAGHDVPRAGSARRAKVPDAANGVRAGRAPALQGGRTVVRERRRKSRIAIARFGRCGAGRKREG